MKEIKAKYLLVDSENISKKIIFFVKYLMEEQLVMFMFLMDVRQ